MADSLPGDSIQHAIPASAVQSSVVKSTITKRSAKPKKGLGAKKVGGLGGKKVTKADFEKLEKSVEENEQIKQRLDQTSTKTSKNEEPRGESLRLAYQDIASTEKQNNVKLSKMDDTKKQQASRLGMGMGKTDGVSHSLDMVTINQENPEQKSRRGRHKNDGDTFYDAFSNRRNRYRWDASDSEDEDMLSKDTYSFTSKKPSSSVDPPPTYTITPIDDGHTAKASLTATTVEPTINRQRNVGKPRDSNQESSLSEFADASAISSDMLYGNNRNTPGNEGNFRDGVKEGVKSVAGRLSNLAFDVTSTIQDRYG